METLRNKRIRTLVKTLNSRRKQQTKKIDILCKDIVGAHKKYVGQLQQLSLVLDYYEAILGNSSAESAFDATAEFIQDSIAKANVAIYFKGAFRSHIVDTEIQTQGDAELLEGIFSPAIARGICESGIADLHDVSQCGFDIDANFLKHLATALIPFRSDPDNGFVLLYRDAKHQFTANEINSVRTLAGGIGKSAAKFNVAASDWAVQI